MFETLGKYEQRREHHRNLIKEAKIDRERRQVKEVQRTQSGLVRSALKGLVGRMMTGGSQRLTKRRVSPQSGATLEDCC